MRKQLALVILLVLVTGSILTVAGCGNKDKAKDYMKTGDELSTKLAGLNNAFKSFDLFKFLEEVGVELNESGSIDPATITDTTNEQLDTMIRTGTEAKAEYGKILDLGGVEDYKEYAAARIEAIDSTISIIEDVQLHALQTGLCHARVIGLDAKCKILHLGNGIVALGKLRF